MISFVSLFGIEPDQIRTTCILTPFLTKGLTRKLGIPLLHKGNPYQSGSSKHLTLIHTRMGPAFAGDCVLYLKDTPCRTIILLGACGLARKTPSLEIGSVVAVKDCYAMESFSQLLNDKTAAPLLTCADTRLLGQFQTAASPLRLTTVRCASFGSFKLEETYADFLQKEKIDVMDMECSALFAAASSIGRQALAILYVTDILGETHPFRRRPVQEQQIIDTAVDKIAALILKMASRL